MDQQWDQRWDQGDIKIYLETNESEDTTIKICGALEINPKKEIHSITGLPKKQEKFQINSLTIYT